MLWDAIPIDRSLRTASTDTEFPMCFKRAFNCASASTMSLLRPTTSEGARWATERSAERCHSESGARGERKPKSVCAYQKPRKRVPSAAEMIVVGRKCARVRYVSRTDTSGIKVDRRYGVRRASGNELYAIFGRCTRATHFAEVRSGVHLGQRNALRSVQREQFGQERRPESFRRLSSGLGEPP